MNHQFGNRELFGSPLESIGSKPSPVHAYTEDHVVIAVDFDGTICEVDYPKIGPERKDAKKYINMLYDLGYLIVINTCRTGEPETLAKNYLEARGINYHYFNENCPHLIDAYGQDCRKISADVYIDDKCLFEIPSWEEKYRIIRERFPYSDDKHCKGVWEDEPNQEQENERG